MTDKHLLAEIESIDSSGHYVDIKMKKPSKVESVSIKNATFQDILYKDRLMNLMYNDGLKNCVCLLQLQHQKHSNYELIAIYAPGKIVMS